MILRAVSVARAAREPRAAGERERAQAAPLAAGAAGSRLPGSLACSRDLQLAMCASQAASEVSPPTLLRCSSQLFLVCGLRLLGLPPPAAIVAPPAGGGVAPLAAGRGAPPLPAGRGAPPAASVELPPLAAGAKLGLAPLAAGLEEGFGT